MDKKVTTNQRIAIPAKQMLGEIAKDSHRTDVGQLTVIIEEAYAKWKKQEAK